MTTPTNFQNAYGIIVEAYFNASLTGEGQTPSSEKSAFAMNKLNRMVQLKQTKGLKLWTNMDLPVTLVAGVNLYTFGPGGTVVMTRPVRAPMAYYSDVNGIRRPIEPISRQEWDLLSQVNQLGAINNYFVDKQQLSLNVYLWLTPDASAATGSLHLIIQQQITYNTSLLDTINFPIEWSQWLTWGLAQQLAVGQPDAIVARCKGEADIAENILEGWDVEDTVTFFTPDARGAYGGNSFR